MGLGLGLGFGFGFAHPNPHPNPHPNLRVQRGRRLRGRLLGRTPRLRRTLHLLRVAAADRAKEDGARAGPTAGAGAGLRGGSARPR